jgi:hypothetical protein
MIPRLRMNQHRLVVLAVTFCLMISCLMISGCTPTLETRYAASRGSSINGINTFLTLLRQSGRTVTVLPGLVKGMEWEYQTIIVFQSEFDELSEKSQGDLHRLILSGLMRTLVIIVRDSDAALDYWRQMQDRSELSSSAIDDARRSYETFRTDFLSQTKTEFLPGPGKWYGLKRIDRSTDVPVKTIEQDCDEGLLTVQARWPLHRRLEPGDSAVVVWRSGDDPLFTVEETLMARVMVLGSATPLLNGGLVDPGNRQLAVEFLGWIPEGDRVAVAVSSQMFEDQESNAQGPQIWNFVKVHPNGFVFGQGILALLVFCWWKFPIFGRPRLVVSHETARFGRHVDAFGKLLRKTRDVTFAKQRIRDWNRVQKSSETKKSGY